MDIFSCLASLGLGALSVHLIYRYQIGKFHTLAQEIIRRAEKQTQTLEKECELSIQQKEFEHRNALEKLSEQKMQKIHVREEKLDRQLTLIEKKMSELEKKEKALVQCQEHIKHQETELATLITQQLEALQSLSGMSAEAARQQLYNRFTQEIQAECHTLLAKKKQEIDEEAARYAASTVSTAINRLCTATISEAATTTVALPSSEIKGRVIGREGRNIRVLEQTTGVNFCLDDTPDMIVISGFDPIRRQIAKVALKDLIQDGRIHPTRIEEAVALATEKVHRHIKEAGEEAAATVGILDMHPKLSELLGSLCFRFSNGQNVLAHSLEVSDLMGMIAAELQLDIALAKRIGLLHDIGKAITQEQEGSHALLGQEYALKYGETEEVANGIGCHHDEILPTTIEAGLCSSANKISAGRPGARSEALEQFLKRSSKLEQISRQFEGVQKAYAMHAGKEIRVFVEPDHFDDQATLHLARNIAKKIEKELSYPGKIKVTVIREKRAIEYAI